MATDEASSPPTIFPGGGSIKEVYPGGFCFRFDQAFSGKGVMAFYPKFLYFVLFASLASAVPFLALFWEAKGLDKWQIGLIAGVRPFISFVTAPLWGFLADRTQQHKPLMALSCLLAAFMMLLLWEAEGFVGITLVMVLLAATEAPVGPLLDNTVLLWLHSSGGGKENYGRERLWGAISWGLLALIMGYVLSIASTWFWGLAVYAIGMLLFVLALWLSRISFPEVQALPAWREVRVLLANGRVVSFFFTIFIMGMGFCIISSFLFLFLREIGGSELLMGLSLVFTVATEIPFFFYAGWALRRFGVHALLVTAMLAYLLRLLAYSYLNHAWLVLPFELLHGLTFGATWAAGIHHTSSLAPRGLEATAQTIFGGLFSGLGGFVGAVFGGWLYESWGPRVMFRVLAVLIGLNTLLFCWTEREVLFASLSRRRGGRWLRWREEDGGGESSECVEGEEVYEKKEKEDRDSYLQLEREGEAWRISKENEEGRTTEKKMKAAK